MNLESHPAITLRQVWHFVVAAETGTMSEAARRLHMAPSAISMSISELERIIGAELCVKRKAKGLTLTSTGRAVFQQARQLLELADDIASLSRGDRPSLRGPLTVGCFMTLGPTIIPPMLTGFAAQCPHVEVDFVEGFHEDLQQRLLDGSLDAAFLYDSDVSPALRTAPLARAEPYVLVAADHPLHAAERIALKDIARDPLILFDAPPISLRILEMYRDAGVSPEILHRSRSYATVRSLVSSGRGVAVLFQQPALEAPYEELRVLLKPLEGPRALPPEPVTVSVAWPRSTRLNARAQAWVEVAQELFAQRA
jgi:DNA-binding transcriptional LysR family regulator